MKIEIKNRFTGAVLLKVEAGSLGIALEVAVQGGGVKLYYEAIGPPPLGFEALRARRGERR